MPQNSRTLVNSGLVLLLEGMLLLLVIAFAFFGAWRYGLLFQAWASDHTGISVAITLVFLIAAGHGSICVVRLSGALNHLVAVQRQIAADGALGARALPDGCVSRYIRDLRTKATLSGPRGIDQGLLLDSFESELKQGHLFGWFVSDFLLSLGLLGTVVGFIVMLGPGSGLDAGDRSTLEGALASMSGGMAVALYTTLAALIGGMLLKIQCFLLDGAVDELVRDTARLTEAHVLPTMRRMQSDAAAV
jgi:MotA/TolQ/ExbB proton channel family